MTDSSVVDNSLPSAQTPSRGRGQLGAFGDLPLRNKLVLILLAVTLLSVGAITILNYFSTTATLTSQVGDKIKSLAASQALDMGTTLARNVNVVQSFSLSEQIRDAATAQNAAHSGDVKAEIAKLDEQWIAASDDDPLIQAHLTNALAAKLKEFKSNFPDYVEVFVTDRHGAIVATSDRTSDYYQADEGWWQAAYNNGQGNVYIGEPEFDESAQAFAINIAIPLYDQSQRDIIGVLRTTLDIASLLNLMQAGEAQIGKAGHSHLVVSGNLMLSPTGGAPETLDSTTTAQLNAIEGYKKMSFEGMSSLVSQAPVSSLTGEEFISNLGWKLVIYQGQGEALSIVGSQTRNAVLIAILIGGLMVVIANAFGRTLTTPLTQLTDTVTQFTIGNLEARADVESSDEIGMLATTFNTMAEQVRDLLANLEDRGQELSERTREMEASQRVTLAASERTTPDALLDLVVNLIRDQFHLYHVQVYMVETSPSTPPASGGETAGGTEGGQVAVLRKSTGYAGRRLLQRGHQIPLDRPALVTRAIHEGQSVLVNDTSADANFMPNPLLPHTRSELVVPLKLVDKTIGVLDAQDRVPGRFGESTVGLFQTMSNQVAFLFENSDLLDSVTEQSEALTIFATQLRTASEIARQLGSILDPDLLLQQVVDMMQSRYGLYHAHIYVLETSQGGNGQGPGGELDARQLTIRAGSGEVGRVLRERGHSIPLSAEKSLVARAARSQETIVVKDTTLISDFMPNPLLPQTRSELAVPLIAGDQVLGVLDMQDDQPDRFSESELDTFGTLAGQIGTTLQTAALFAQVQARFRVSQALAGTQTEDDVLDAMMAVADFYPQAQVLLATYDQEAKEATLVARRVSSFESDVAPVEVGARFPASQFRIIDSFSPGEPLVVSNLPTDERIDSTSRQFLTRMGIVSMSIIPIAVGDEHIGVLRASSSKPGYFDERKLHLYQSLAEQGAMALRTGQLFDETQHTAERLREIDRVKGEFLASMSHELRTPLNSIIGFAEIMLMGIDGELPSGAQEDTQAIFDNGQHLLSLINDVLDLTKIEAGYLALHMEEVPIEPLIDTVKNNTAGLLLAKPAVEFMVEIKDPETLPSIQGDEVRLTQILNNLISNAVKFTSEGAVTLRAYQDHPAWVCLEIEDSGIGISEDNLEKVFDRFHQVDSSESRSAGGTGLGLPITRHLIELHGGTIDARSQVGVGSTFSVRLPAFALEEQDEEEKD